MSEQFSLFDAAPPASPAAHQAKAVAKGERAPYSLFFSIFPTSGDAQRIASLAASLQQMHGLTGRPLLQHRLHVTLHDVGGYTELPTDIVSTAKRAADTLALPAFEVMFDHALSFPGSGTYVLGGGAGCDPLAEFHKSLGAAMKDQGLRAKNGFTPHMTLLYDRHPVAQHPIEPLRWRVKEFVLILSHVGKGQYDLLGRWPLRA